MYNALGPALAKALMDDRLRAVGHPGRAPAKRPTIVRSRRRRRIRTRLALRLARTR